MLRSLMMVPPKKRPPEIVTVTTVGTQTVSVPVGALLVTAECISGGGAIKPLGLGSAGGGGGSYSKRTNYSLSGVTSLRTRVGDTNESSYVGLSDSSFICYAEPPNIDSTLGGPAGSGTGDVRFSGGAGTLIDFNTDGSGGGAANDGGNGGDASGTTPGIAGSGTAPAGAGGQLYGGGGIRLINSGNGLRGWVKLTFTF